MTVVKSGRALHDGRGCGRAARRGGIDGHTRFVSRVCINDFRRTKKIISCFRSLSCVTDRRLNNNHCTHVAGSVNNNARPSPRPSLSLSLFLSLSLGLISCVGEDARTSIQVENDRGNVVRSFSDARLTRGPYRVVFRVTLYHATL